MNKIIKNTLILAAITVVSGLVLGAAYEVTKDPIAQTQAKQKQEACQAVYPEADSFEAMDVDQKAAKEAIKRWEPMQRLMKFIQQSWMEVKLVML